jgi:hypothetical protein
MPDDKDNSAPASGASANKSAATAAATPVEHEISLTQFGIEASKSEKRVELLNAFVFTQRQARQFKDTKSNYLARFADFAKQPA